MLKRNASRATHCGLVMPWRKQSLDPVTAIDENVYGRAANLPLVQEVNLARMQAGERGP